MVPRGFRFNPSDEELIQILDQKISGGQEIPLQFIVQANVYEHEPQDLEWNQALAVSNNERYYYCKKENDSREVLGRGWWKATSHVKRVHANAQLVGYKRPLTYHRFKDNNGNRNNAIKTNWIMHEYSLESRATEWRLCKIKYKGKPSIQEEMENIRQSHSSRENAEAGSSNSTMTQVGSAGKQEEQQQQDLFLANPSVQTEWNMQQQQQQQPPGSQPPMLSPYLPPDLYSTGNYLAEEQLAEQIELHEQPFPSLWSWQD